MQVYAKEIVIPRAASLATPTSPYSKSKYKTITVELYLEPSGCVGVVDVLVEEGLNMDYATSPHVVTTSENGSSSSLGSPEPWEGGRVTKKTRKKLTDLPTVSGNSLHMYGGDGFDGEDPLPDLDDSLVKPKNNEGCGLEEDGGYVTPPELLIGQDEDKKNQTQPVSPWQAFQKFCDEFL
jgi:hypothetical protein